MTDFTHCRCGASALESFMGKSYVSMQCPDINDGKPFVYHDLVAQVQTHYTGRPCWAVVVEGDMFRAYGGFDPSPALFPTKEAAWAELEQLYWGHIEWPGDE